jgi:hypothetical protein
MKASQRAVFFDLTDYHSVHAEKNDLGVASTLLI